MGAYLRRPILFLLDYQEGVCLSHGAVGAEGIAAEVARRDVLSKACEVMQYFRRKSWPVVYTMLAFDEQYQNMTSGSARFASLRNAGLMRRSDPSTSICTQLQPRPEDFIIVKGCVNPFIGTGLEQLLHRLRPEEIVIGGVATNHVVELAARHAADIGYHVILLEDLCASFNEAAHRNSIKHNIPFYAQIMTSTLYLEIEDTSPAGAALP